MVTDKDRLYLLLKREGPCTFSQIRSHLRIPDGDYETLFQLFELIDEEEDKGYLSTEGGVVSISIVLDPPVRVRKKSFLWEEAVVSEEPIPVSWQNPHIKDTAHRAQGRGTCTGETGAGLMDLNYIELSGDVPTAEDRANFKRDVVDPSGVIHDILFFQSFSAECAYQWGRKEGNITYPSGGSTQAVMKTLVKRGICFDEDWPTSKDSRHCYLEPLSAEMQAKVDASAPLHKLDGFVSVGNNFDRVCKAINEAGKVSVSIDIFRNYIEMKGGDGTFPEPPKDLERDGAHAMLAYGYDDNYIFVVHTWGDWCGRYGKFSRNYAAKGLMEAFKPIDATEAAKLRENYQKVTITCNIPVEVFINNEFVGSIPKDIIQPNLLIGGVYTITVAETGHSANSVTIQYTPRKGVDTINIFLNPHVEPPQDSPLTKIIKAFVAWIKKLFEVG